MDSKANSSSILRNDSALLEGVEDALNRVLLHGEEEARAHLRLRGTRVEEGRGRVSEPLVAHKIVCLESRLKVIQMD